MYGTLECVRINVLEIVFEVYQYMANHIARTKTLIVYNVHENAKSKTVSKRRRFIQVNDLKVN